jgi:hypothetical protein
MEVEQAFDIRIPDSEAQRIDTVGDFYEVVWQHVQRGAQEKCQTQKVFYQLRKVMEASNGTSVPIIPASSPNRCVPVEKRRECYRQLEQSMQLSLPPLVLPEPLGGSWLLLASCLVVGSFN